jgi:integrase/recombinase XerD
MCSFPHVRDWLNEQPFRNEPNARLICNLHTGAPLKPKALWNMMKQLQKKVIRLSKNGEIEVVEEKRKTGIFVK